MNLVVVSTMDNTGTGGGLSRLCRRGGWIHTVSAWTLVLQLPAVRKVLLATCAGARWASHSWHVCSRAARKIEALAFFVFSTFASTKLVGWLRFRCGRCTVQRCQLGLLQPCGDATVVVDLVIILFHEWCTLSVALQRRQRLLLFCSAVACIASVGSSGQKSCWVKSWRMLAHCSHICGW